MQIRSNPASSRYSLNSYGLPCYPMSLCAGLLKLPLECKLASMITVPVMQSDMMPRPMPDQTGVMCFPSLGRSRHRLEYDGGSMLLLQWDEIHPCKCSPLFRLMHPLNPFAHVRVTVFRMHSGMPHSLNLFTLF